ncbi:probable beta-1,4-xylosyltransferase IRX14 [Typha angustifolia]|uniref:probable beta-1,4-xylosyltransferase IRX14 n=1 Tax=Typha angustifolia TaxID=59011 RepID=UPI003C2E9EB7
MKLSLLQTNNNRRGAGYRPAAAGAEVGGGGGGVGAEGSLKSSMSAFWLLLHGLCCVISLVLGFRFSRLVFFLLFSPANLHPSAPVFRAIATRTTKTTTTTTTTATLTVSFPSSHPPPVVSNATASQSHVVVGRHGIRIRPWPHPDPAEVLRAHRIIERVQSEQRLLYGVQNPRPVLVVTPTYARTFQALHLTGLAHTLRLVPYPVTWIVVEAGGLSNETAALLSRSRVQFLHIPFVESMPAEWSDRHLTEARMRLRALRVIRERRMDGLVVFADDSNMHSMELFDEIQKVKWMGAASVGILAHSGKPNDRQLSEEEKQNFPVPVQGPACNSSGQLAGWHTFNSLPYAEKSATLVGDGATVLPRKLEWAGFVLNSRLLWKEAEGKPEWVRDLDAVGENGEEIESPLVLLKDASFVEPLGNCGKKVMLWWLRVEARADSKFPSGWIIDPPLEIIVPAKRTPWPDMPTDIQSELENTKQEHEERRFSRTSRSRSRSSRRKGDTQRQDK